MKTLHVIHSLNPDGGGPAHFLAQLSTLGMQPEFDMEIVSLDSPEESNGSSIACPVHALGPSSAGYGLNLRLVPWLAKHHHRFDLVIVHGIWQYSSFGTWLALAGSDTPYMVYPHGMLDPWFKQRYPVKHLKKTLYWPWSEYCVLRDAQAVLFTCEQERRLAKQSFHPYRCREIVIGHGTVAPPNHPDRQIELFYGKYPHLKGQRVLLFFGRLAEKKGLDLLLSAFADSAGSQQLHLVLAGPPSPEYKSKLDGQLSALSTEIRSRITMTGLLLDDLKWGALRSADALILPSHQENFGQSVSEALSCGVPVLLSDKVNIWREVTEAGAGLVEPDDLAGVKNLLLRWIKLEPSTRELMRRKAAECYDKHFELSKSVLRLIMIANSLRAQSGQRSRSAM